MNTLENSKVKRKIRAVSRQNLRNNAGTCAEINTELTRECSPGVRYKRPPGLVYFIRCGDAIKIGYTFNMARRMMDLQMCNPQALELLVAFAGGHEEEHFLHDKFADLHIRGEWFQYHQTILEYIDWKIGRKRMRGRIPGGDRRTRTRTVHGETR